MHIEVKSQTAAKRNILAALDCVAQRLGNTRAVCRKSYVHPGLLDAYLVWGSFKLEARNVSRSGLSSIEKPCAIILLGSHVAARLELKCS